MSNSVSDSYPQIRGSFACSGASRSCLFFVSLPRRHRQKSNHKSCPFGPPAPPGFEDRRNEPEEAKDYWVKNIHNPSITIFPAPADKANGCAVLICPGGGHRELVFKAEGEDPAKFLNNLGVTAFVLKYRLAREENSPYKLDVHPKQDAYRAMRFIRSRADEWHIDPKRVGILGFSAGGEVVSWVAYEPGDGDPNAADPIDRLNGRPDFQMVVYPGPLGIPDTVPKDHRPPSSSSPTTTTATCSRSSSCSTSIGTPAHRLKSTSLAAVATPSTWATAPRSPPSSIGPTAWPTGSPTTIGSNRSKTRRQMRNSGFYGATTALLENIDPPWFIQL